jgi:hypothetical protein
VTAPRIDCATIIKSNNVIRVLANIDADHGNRNLCCCRHGVLLVWASPASLALARQEHGRTIPLADIRGAGFMERRVRI